MYWGVVRRFCLPKPFGGYLLFSKTAFFVQPKANISPPQAEKYERSLIKCMHRDGVNLHVLARIMVRLFDWITVLSSSLTSICTSVMTHNTTAQTISLTCN